MEKTNIITTDEGVKKCIECGAFHSFPNIGEDGNCNYCRKN